jgi:hypothetical protein
MASMIPQRQLFDTTCAVVPGQGQCHPEASTTARDSTPPWLAQHRLRANERGPSRSSCNSIKNADASIAATRFVRVTHPFHPLSGHQLACVGERYNRYGMTLLLACDDGSIYSVPPQWTDLVSPDPEIVMGKERALFRVVDLLELALLVVRQRQDDTSGSPEVNVMQITPHV